MAGTAVSSKTSSQSPIARMIEATLSASAMVISFGSSVRSQYSAVTRMSSG